MTGRKGQSGGGDGEDHVIEYTPDGRFNIRRSARDFAAWMEETGLPLLLHLPHVSVEFEAGCTPQEIIDGYFYALQYRGKPAGMQPSNGNDLPTTV